MIAAADLKIVRALNRTHGGYGALRATMYGNPPTGRTNDQDKTRVSLRLLAHYTRTRERFFLAVGLSSTHVQAGKICMAGAAMAEGGAPVPTSHQLAPNRGLEHHPPLLTWPNWDLTRFDVGWKWQREAIGEYYACATHVDAQLGALLDALDVLQLAQTTSVVVQGDHGFSLGRHGRWSKYSLYEDSTRVPLIIAVPGGRAKVVEDVVESLDVMPTILELWGVKRVPAPPQAAAASSATASLPHYALNGAATPLEGDSLLPYLLPGPGETSALSPWASTLPAGATASAPVRRATYARSELREWMVANRPNDPQLPGAKPMRMVGRGAQLYLRTRTHSYVAYFRPRCGCAPGLVLVDETLFDLTSDAGEASNLAYAPAHSQTRRELLGVVTREWGLGVIGSTRADRPARQAMISELASCFNYSLRCPTTLGVLR